jgi:pimeloyl-ACP methyl ester carboxylesterase
MLSDGQAQSRFIRPASGTRVHVVESGAGEPLILLHGTSTSSLSHVPFLPALGGVRAINLDRPGFGLSDPAPLTPMRSAAVAFVDEAADALGLDTFSLGGASMGGTWALWYALHRPMRVRRLALLGASPLLPGTRPPAPIRVAVAPVIGDLLARIPPSERLVVRMMGAMGEGETIVHHPDLLASLVAAGKDPVAARANLAEFRAIASPVGFRRHMLISREDLRRVSVPTLVVWGDRDPVGSVDAARDVTDLIPDARLEVLPAGHVPWLGNVDRVAALLSAFISGASAS